MLLLVRHAYLLHDAHYINNNVFTYRVYKLYSRCVGQLPVNEAEIDGYYRSCREIDYYLV